MMAKPMTALESHHPIMQFYIVMIICCQVYETNGNGSSAEVKLYCWERGEFLNDFCRSYNGSNFLDSCGD